MFLKNTSHLQHDLFGIESHLCDAKRDKLLNSPEAAFYEIVFCAIHEQDFAPLYSDGHGRPNAPINALVASIILQNRKGWTTRELFDRIDFDLRTRLALGLRTLDETPFSQASFFNFQNRLLHYFCTSGINLMEQVFDKLTSEQLSKLKIKTDIQRMDSFQAMSNIRSYSRTQLLVEMLIRLNRVFSEQHRLEVRQLLAPYIHQNSSKFVYGLTRSEIPHELEKLGSVYHSLYQQFKSIYGDCEVFKIFERVYTEHFCVVSDSVIVRDSQEIGSDSLQSPDDIDATFRHKRGSNYQGQVVNITETANPQNALNLITDVTVAANNTDDSTMLGDRIDALKGKCSDLNELHTDGGYGSSDNDTKMQSHEITHVQTAVRGRTAGVEMRIQQTASGEHSVSCPQQTAMSRPTRKRYKACFDATICAGCTHRDECQTKQQKHCRVFYFTNEMVVMQQRVHAIEKLPPQRQRLRPNIEATVKEYTKGFNHKGKLRLRGKFAATLFAITMSIAINFGRIYRHITRDPRLRAIFARATACVSILCRTMRTCDRVVTFSIPKMSKNDMKTIAYQVISESTF